MLRVLVAVEAVPGEKVKFESPKPIQGYFQTLGVTARDNIELEDLGRQFLQQDLESTLLEISEIWEPDFEGNDSDIRELCADIDAPGIWYSSGRAWYWGYKSVS